MAGEVSGKGKDGEGSGNVRTVRDRFFEDFDRFAA